MPCYTTTRIEMNLKNMNLERAKAALDAMGYNTILRTAGTVVKFLHGGTRQLGEDCLSATDGDHVFTCWKNGEIKIRGSNPEEAQRLFQKQYAAETIKTAAKRFGWTVKAQVNNQIHLTR